MTKLSFAKSDIARIADGRWSHTVARLANHTKVLQRSNTHNCAAPKGKAQIPMFAELGIAATPEALSPEPVAPISQFNPLSWEWVSVDEACRLFGLSRIGLYRLMKPPSEGPAPLAAGDSKPAAA